MPWIGQVADGLEMNWVGRNRAFFSVFSPS
jgi:hypothetical protein